MVAFERSQNLAKMKLVKIMLNIMTNTIGLPSILRASTTSSVVETRARMEYELMDEYVRRSEDQLYFVALLNSVVLEYYHKHIAPIFGGKYYSYNKRYLEPHPIVLPDDVPENTVTEYAEDIQGVRAERTDLEYKTSDIRNYPPAYERDSSVLNLAQPINHDGDNYRQGPIRKNVKMEVDSVEKVYQVVMKQGHIIEFEDERVRDFVFELLTAQKGPLSLGLRERLDLYISQGWYE